MNVILLKHTVRATTIVIYLLVWFVSAQAQANIQLDRLSIGIWPEYDRPQALVIYRGQLADSVPLPATLSFQLPGHVQTLNAVAVLNEQNSLVNNPYTVEQEGDSLRLDFTVDTPRFQFEYYDPDILTKDGVNRTLAYSTQAPYPVADLSVEVQQPPSATDVQFSPQPTNVFVGEDQLTYHIVRQNNARPGQLISLQGEYRKENDTLTTNLTVSSAQNTQPEVFVNPASTQAISPGYWVIGLGVVLLLVATGWWFFFARVKVAPVGPTITGQGKDRYCYQCGTAYHSDARFCHNCGAPRRESKK